MRGTSTGAQGRGVHQPTQVRRRPRHARRARGTAVAAAQPRPRRGRRRNRRVCQSDRTPVPRRPRASRGRRDAGDHRIDPCRARVPAEAGRRRRHHQTTRRVLLEASGCHVVGQSGNSGARQHPLRAAVDPVVHRETPERQLPAPQLRRRATQRSLRHPVPRRMLVRGPYGHRLLGIDIERSHEFEHEITQGCEGIKPGWTRLSFNYFISEAVFQYLVDAVDLVAAHGWKLLPDYHFNPATGLWRHHDGPVEPPLRLSQLSYDPVTGQLQRPPPDCVRAPETALVGYLDTARQLIAAAPLGPRRTRIRERYPPSSSTCAGSIFPRNR